MAQLISTNPSRNFEKIGSVRISSEKEIRQAVDNAKKAFKQWRRLSVKERANYLQDVYDKLYAKSDEISNLVSTEMGFPIKDQKLFDMGDGFDYFKWYIENAEKILADEITHEDDNEIHKVVYEPYGVSAVIQPWNFPFCQWSWGVVPSLIAGDTVVFKHSEECPLSGKLISDIISESSLPDGVFSEIYGDGKVGAMLLDQDIDLIVFTGSYKVGKEVYKKGAEKFIKVLLELGGSAPGVVFEDADTQPTVQNIFELRFTNCGQACDGLKRLIVHESLFDKIVAGLKQAIESKKIGDATDKANYFGPLVAERQVKLLEEQLKDATDKGADVVTGGKRPADLKGAYFEPTLLTNVTGDMRVWKEEVFGPLLPVVSFKTEAEAIELANDTEYGLGGYVFSEDLERADRVARSIESGEISINGVNYVCPHNPFGGYKHSGFGREHGKQGLHDLSQVKIIVMNKK
ncbi:aldehyde dehydrogenase family protein [Candidatus Dojkabacteria bacterium]|nr:aldehyde dehydrogenase family protein [Candidatus Dojkabacteria bacterium]